MSTEKIQSDNIKSEKDVMKKIKQGKGVLMEVLLQVTWERL